MAHDGSVSGNNNSLPATGVPAGRNPSPAGSIGPSIQAKTGVAAIPGAELSVVVPFWNEEQNVVPLAEQVFRVFRNEPRALELVLVDDASTDGTWQQMLRGKHAHAAVRPVRLLW